MGESDAVTRGEHDVDVVHEPSTVALAMVLDVNSKKPAGCRFDESAMER